MQRYLGHILKVFGDTLIGIINIATCLDAVECAAMEPLLQVDVSNPLSPPHLKGLIEPCAHGIGTDAADGDDERLTHEFPHQGLVVGSEGIEEILIPIGQPSSYPHDSHVEQEDKEKQAARDPFLLRYPPRLYQLPAI